MLGRCLCVIGTGICVVYVIHTDMHTLQQCTYTNQHAAMMYIHQSTFTTKHTHHEKHPPQNTQAKGKTSEAISKLMNLAPATAILVQQTVNGQPMGETVIETHLIHRGDVLKVLPGARVPADGQVSRGSSYVDESMLTGESRPVFKVCCLWGVLTVGVVFGCCMGGGLFMGVAKVGCSAHVTFSPQFSPLVFLPLFFVVCAHDFFTPTPPPHLSPTPPLLTPPPPKNTQAEGDVLLGGTVNGSGTMWMEATRVGQGSTLSQIVRLMEAAQLSKAPIQALADKISGVFVPIVVCLAFMTWLGWYVCWGVLGCGCLCEHCWMLIMLIIYMCIFYMLCIHTPMVPPPPPTGMPLALLVWLIPPSSPTATHGFSSPCSLVSPSLSLHAHAPSGSQPPRR